MNNPYERSLPEITETPFRSGNYLSLLQNGDEIFPAMLEAIRSATQHIEFLSYVFIRGEVADQFADALCERARAGVTVRLLVDTIGGATMSSRMAWQLERAGVRMGWFRGRIRHAHKLNNRTHRKILLIDGKIGFTGGVGIADFWLGKAQDPQHWRETHVRVTGPICVDLHAGFAENWREATKEQLGPVQPTTATPAPAAVPPASARPFGPLQLHATISTAGRRPTAAERLIRGLFATATERLWITTGYFVLTRTIIADLAAVARRGVDVRVLTGGRHTDHRLTLLAGRSSYRPLLEAGIQIYEYETTMIHSKIITVDRQLASIGSINLDARSLYLNDELNISGIDPALVAALDDQFLADLHHARQIHPEQWHTRSRLDRIAEAGSSVFRHQL